MRNVGLLGVRSSWCWRQLRLPTCLWSCLSTAGWWQGLLGQGWDRGDGVRPESVLMGLQGVEGVHGVGSGITVGRKDRHSHMHLCSPGRNIPRQWTALQVGCGGQGEAELLGSALLRQEGSGFVPSGAGTTPGPACPLPEPLPGLGWVILTAKAGREPVGWPHCPAGSEPQVGAA